MDFYDRLFCNKVEGLLIEPINLTQVPNSDSYQSAENVYTNWPIAMDGHLYVHSNMAMRHICYVIVIHTVS